MIPKIIHYCWLSGDSFPEKISYCINSWKKVLPDYELMLWDLNRFDLNKSAWVKQAYQEKKYAFAADYIRLYAVYNYGGIYLDSDVEVIKRFDDLLNLPYFIGYENENNGDLEAAIFGAEKGQKWVSDCLSYYKDRYFITEAGLDMTPLPGIMNRIISQNSEKILSKFDFNPLSEKIQILPKTYFSPKNGTTGELTFLTADTYTIHHYAASWFPFSKRMYKLIYKLFGSHVANSCSKLIKSLGVK